jgi:biopolymer transport protein ExbB/TolQ
MGQKSEPVAVLAARYRVTGAVERIDQQLRVHAHLVDEHSGRQIWSERYHRPFANLFQIQEDISRQVVSSLAIQVNEEERRRLARRYTNSLPAYEAFLRAQALLLVRSRAENAQARRLYRQAIDLDPSFGRAYGGLALSFAADFRNQWTPRGREALERAGSMARTALEIDPEIPEVYWVLAYVSAQQHRHEQALSLLRKAISLDPSFADAYALMGGVSTYVGRPFETLGLIRTAARLNPDAGYLYFLLLGRAYFFLEDWSQALINLDQALQRNPANLEAHIYRAATLESAADHDAALWEREEILALQPDFAAAAWLQTYPMTDRGQIARLESGLTLLKIISAIAPLMGLLGTVTGMIVTFQAITIFGAGDPKAMAGGISGALVTTVLGLLVAIPTVLLHTIVNGRAQRIIHVLNEQTTGIIAEHTEANLRK